MLASNKKNLLREKVSTLLDRITPDIGKQATQMLEAELLVIVSESVAVLKSFTAHEKPEAREVVAVVLGRLYARQNQSTAGCQKMLEILSRDPDKWVRIKADRGLRKSQSKYERMSPLANACIGALFALDKPGLGYQQDIRNSIDKKIHRKRKKKDDIETLKSLALAYHGLAPIRAATHQIDTSKGWKGDEMYVAQMTYFISGNKNALIACVPSDTDLVFAIILDEKFPEFFGLLYQKRSSSTYQRRLVAEQLQDTSGRGESQMEVLLQNGWQSIFPKRK